MNEEETELRAYLDEKYEISGDENEWLEDYLIKEQDPRLRESSAVDNTEFIVAALKHLGVKHATETFTCESMKTADSESTKTAESESMKTAESESMKTAEDKDYDTECDDLESLGEDSIAKIKDQIIVEDGKPSIFVQVSIPDKGIYEGRLYLVKQLIKSIIENNQRSNENFTTNVININD